MRGVPLSPGSVFGRYVIESRLGAGSIGVVYLARDPTLGRNVALKLLNPELATDADFRSRFVANARSAAKLDHPNLLPVYEAGERDDQLYFATRYVPGLDLGTLIAREGALSLERSLLFLAQIASALDAAHTSGLVHGNVKLSNVLVATGDHAYLADFGLAATATSSGGAQHTGQSLKVAHTAPELLMGATATPHSDIYALARSFVECLTGPPVRAQTHGVTDDRPGLDMNPHRVNLPGALDAVIARALTELPQARFPTATAFAVAAASASGVAAATVGSDLSASGVQRPPELRVRAAESRPNPVARLVLASVASFVILATGAIAFVAHDSDRLSDLNTPAPPISHPSTSPVSSPTARALGFISLSAEELALPLSEFPFPGHGIVRDLAASAIGWRRDYRTGYILTAPYVIDVVDVWPSVGQATAVLAAALANCPFPQPAPLGDMSAACARPETAQRSSLTLLLVVRNVSVALTAPAVLATDHELRLSELVAIGRAHRAWIERIAPEDGSMPTKPVPAPTPRIVTLRNEQIALPLADFPLPGYSLGADGVYFDSWFREFISSEARAPRPNRRISVTIRVEGSEYLAEVRFAATSPCFGEAGATSTSKEIPTSIGDRARACVPGSANQPDRTIKFTAVWRNVVISMYTDVENEPNEVRAEQLVSVARAQFAVIDRVAPP